MKYRRKILQLHEVLGLFLGGYMAKTDKIKEVQT